MPSESPAESVQATRSARRRYELGLTTAQTWAELGRIAHDGGWTRAHERSTISLRAVDDTRFELAWHDAEMLAIVEGSVRARNDVTTVELSLRDSMLTGLQDRSWTALGSAGLACTIGAAVVHWISGGAGLTDLAPLAYFALPLAFALAVGRARRNRAARALLQAVHRRLEPHRQLPGDDPFRRPALGVAGPSQPT